MARRWAWAAVAIVSMWIAVLFVSLFAPSLESTSAAGDVTKVPVAAIVVAGVAFIATIVVAVQGFGGPSARELDEERQRLERERLEARIADLEARLTTHHETPSGRAPTTIGA